MRVVWIEIPSGASALNSASGTMSACGVRSPIRVCPHPSGCHIALSPVDPRTVSEIGVLVDVSQRPDRVITATGTGDVGRRPLRKPYTAPPAQGDRTHRATPRQRIGGHAAAAFPVAKNNPRCVLWLDQLSLGISRKRMSVLAIVP